MRTIFNLIGIGITWFALVTQFILMIQSSQNDTIQVFLKFFSFFTILTNTLVALYFSTQILYIKIFPFSLFRKQGSLTAITTFILIVGTVYQVSLRHLWEPKGWSFVADELLHSVIPLFTLIYWYMFSGKDTSKTGNIFKWLIYPLGYIIIILIQGIYTSYYPYPFLDVNKIGYPSTLINTGVIILVGLLMMLALIFIGRRKERSKI